MEFTAKEISEATRHYTTASIFGRGGFGIVIYSIYYHGHKGFNPCEY